MRTIHLINFLLRGSWTIYLLRSTFLQDISAFNIDNEIHEIEFDGKDLEGDVEGQAEEVIGDGYAPENDNDVVEDEDESEDEDGAGEGLPTSASEIPYS